MPAYFSLTRIGAREASTLQDVDAHMCQAYSASCHPQLWFRGWYDAIGFSLAMGRTFEETAVSFPEFWDICDWLSANYTVDNWYED